MQGGGGLGRRGGWQAVEQSALEQEAQGRRGMEREQARCFIVNQISNRQHRSSLVQQPSSCSSGARFQRTFRRPQRGACSSRRRQFLHSSRLASVAQMAGTMACRNEGRAMALWRQWKNGRRENAGDFGRSISTHIVSLARCAGCSVPPFFPRVVQEQCKRLCCPTSRLRIVECY